MQQKATRRHPPTPTTAQQRPELNKAYTVTRLTGSKHKLPGLLQILVCIGACLALTLALFPGNASAQSPLPPFVINENLDSARITVYSEHFEDVGGQVTLSELLRGEHDQLFQPALSSSEFLGFSANPWWIRLALSNNTEHTRQLLLNMTPGLYGDIRFYSPDYSPDQHSHTERRAGTRADPPWADLRYRSPVFRVDLPAGATHTYYLRIIPDRHLTYTLRLNTLEQQLQRSLHIDGLFLLLTGIILGLVLYNFSLFVLYRSCVYLYYSAFLSALTLAALSGSGFIGVQYFPLPNLQPHTEATAILLAIAASTAFSRIFLNSRQMVREAEPWLLTLIVCALIAALLNWALPAMMALQIAYILALVSVAVLVWVGFACWLRQGDHAGLYLLARSPLIVCVALTIFASFGVLPVSINGPLLVLTTATIEALLFALGLSRKSRAELEQRLNAEQSEALTSATWRIRSETLARLSHEVRTPMSGVLGMAEILRDTPLTPNQKDYVQGIQNAGESLLKILNDVLEYSRLEQGGGDMEVSRFDLTELVMDAVELFRERAEEKQVELIPHIHTNVPQQVEGDAGRLKQALTNLLGTCIRHAQSGELVVDVTRDASGRADNLRFEFEGSALAHSPDLFDPLSGHEAPVANADSSHLGLAIARQLVEAMGGRCGIRSGRSGPSGWFSLLLPAMECTEPTDIDNTLLRGRTILVVDDSSTVTRVIRQQALAWGMRVTACHDPREALASIRTQTNLNDPYDVVLLDHQMPGMTGMQLAARIHEDPVVTRTPLLIMLTGVNDAPTATMARNVGIHRVLAKPVSGPRLRQVLAEELGAVAEKQHDDLDNQSPDPGLRILVAEDHQLSQKVIRGMLAKLGLDADVVANGREALDAACTGNYDLVLMDCEMPEMDGFEATRRIREWERHAQRRPLPIVALTAHILREHRERSMAAGMNAHVPKPVELDTLRRAIVRYTSNPTPAATGAPQDTSPTRDETQG
ncbi:MAG: response regulator [Alcanivorax sp.]|nr:response regulator [Alcanivorax sp.]